jgi:GMP synthase-like glutamine amidotransferase
MASDIEKIAVLDFGSQYSQLISQQRNKRELQAFSVKYCLSI